MKRNIAFYIGAGALVVLGAVTVIGVSEFIRKKLVAGYVLDDEFNSNPFESSVSNGFTTHSDKVSKDNPHTCKQADLVQ